VKDFEVYCFGDNVKKTVCVVGLGTIGLPTALECLKNGLVTYGYDLDTQRVKLACSKGIPAFYAWGSIPEVDVYEVCVSSNAVFDACSLIAKRDCKNVLVAIESTVVPFSCRKIFKEMFGYNVNLVHCPHRFWGLDSNNHGVKQLRVLGGVNTRSLADGTNFFGNLLDIPIHPVSCIEVAELCKIAENVSRYLRIAYAENLSLICEEVGLSFIELQYAINTKWNTTVYDARDGIAGSCLPFAIKSLSSFTQYNKFLKGAIELDKQYQRSLKE